MIGRIALAVAAVAGAVAMVRRFGLREDLEWSAVEKPGVIIDIDGYGVHYVERGDGPAIVLVHGFGGHTRSYTRLMPLLPGHRLVAVDLKGFGYSERDARAGLSHTDQARMLRELLSRLGIERATFVGHSMGGAVVQRVAVMFPECVISLVLIASAAGERRAPRVPTGMLRPVLPLLAAFAASRLLKLSFYESSRMTDELRDEYLRPARIRGSMDGLLAMMRDARNDETVDAERIKHPVLLLWGSEDRVIPLRAAEALLDVLPDARLVVVPEAGHLVTEEQPEACARAIAEFVAGRSSTPVGATSPWGA